MTNFDSASSCKEAQACPATTAAKLLRTIVLGLLAMVTPHLTGQATARIVTRTAPAYVDSVTGLVFVLHLAYEGTTVSTSLTDSVTKAVWSAQVAENIPGIVGSNTAYVGFTAGSGTPSTAGTGTSSAIQNILNWTYSGGAGCDAK